MNEIFKKRSISAVESPKNSSDINWEIFDFPESGMNLKTEQNQKSPNYKFP